MKRTVDDFKQSGDYLPDILKDFHDQKDVFKTMHWNYQNNPPKNHEMPNWEDGQVYVIDWFLWFMATYGYTLQKSRARVDFKDISKMHSARKADETEALKQFLASKSK